MSQLKYFNYPGFGENMAHIYSQAVRIGDRVELSGQGGWDPATSSVDGVAWDIQIEQAFKNVDLALKTAGVQEGWKAVYRINSFHIPFTPEVIEKMGEQAAKWMPDHRPIWTAIEVPRLGLQGMTVEIEVCAYVGKE